MDIDVIDLTLPQYKDMNAIQLAMVKDAQVRKNAEMARAAEEKEKLFRKLLGNNTAQSSMYDAECERINTDRDYNVTVIVEELKYSLAYNDLMQGGNDQGPYSYPANPNYFLTPPDRFLVVRTYYMTNYVDAAMRYQVYQKDALAQHYLGEYYKTLWDILAKYAEEEAASGQTS